MFAASKTDSASTGGYQISRSLRFNSADTTFLNRTPATATNRRTWTWSGWVKKDIGARSLFTSYWANTDNGYFNIVFNSDVLAIQTWAIDARVTTQVFRDPSAWYHIVVAVDTTQASNIDRIKIYVNGLQVTTFSSTGTIAQNTELAVNYNGVHYIGSLTTTAALFNGYMTDVNFIDGQALTPSSFGETNAQTGVWQPKAFAGTYGTNGFYLNFSDNSNTTAATLGKDYSGNGNNWTPNNFSVTAGAGNDSLVDSPTSYGTDTGVGGTVRGNYATGNPLSHLNATFANGNLDLTVAAPETSNAISTLALTSGKWYWEVTPTVADASMIGVCDITAATSNRSWQSANGWAYFRNGQKYNNSSTSAYGASYVANDVIGVALDMDAGTLVFYKNGTSQGTAYSTGLSGKSLTPYLGNGNGGGGASQVYICNFGQRPFAYTAPSGFKALCTQNLPTPTIGATTATQAGKFFNPVLYTGTGSSLGVTGVGFQPDWVWVKGRSGATDHGLYDAVRGVQKQLESNGTGAETTETTGITAFGSDGFTTGALAQLNTSSATYVAWNWKANGSGSSNTAGSITSTVSANTTSGFSIVTYTGTGSAATVGHGLGVAPSMIICKGRSVGGNYWQTQHSALGPTKALFLNTTDSAFTNAAYWNNTAPTSTVFSLGGNTDANGNGTTYVAYCFAEVAGYSKFGSYTGNGSADGPFIFTGFKPAFVLIKSSTVASASWRLWDAKRSTYNVVNSSLFPNLPNAEVSTADYAIDFLSNGIKIRAADDGQNYSGGTFIYAAFAENPFKYSLAR
jgi:hypothetical protein